MEDASGKVVFTGDTLFHGGKFGWSEVGRKDIKTNGDGGIGCGKFFEGTGEEMNTALNKTLAALPDDTKVYVSLIIPFLPSPR